MRGPFERPWRGIQAGILATALSTVPAAAERLTAEAPAGFQVKPIAPSGDQTDALEVTRTVDDAGCAVAFHHVKPEASLSQAQINANAAKPDFLEDLRKREGSKFEDADVGPFVAGAVQGGAIVGTPAGSDGAVRALLVIFDTPEGRTLISCSAKAAQFDALLPAFEAVARSVKPPKG